jgi:hypothetical protein
MLKPKKSLPGIQWDKPQDTLAVSANMNTEDVITKRKVLVAINSVYDILGWASPFMITGKIIFSEICITGIHWDKALPNDITHK